MTNEQLILSTKAFIENYNPEHLPFTNLDCDGNCEVDMKAFAQEIANYMRNSIKQYLYDE